MLVIGNTVVQIFRSPVEGSRFVANEIAKLITHRQQKNELLVLGLPTGNTPQQLYKELVRIHKVRNISFRNVVTFNIDEYHPLPAESDKSFRRFMDEHFFNHVDIPKNQQFIPKSDIPDSEVDQHCFNYEMDIERYGGIDIQILGIGRNGHIGFNEPGSSSESSTRLVELEQMSRVDIASQFGSIDSTPKKAITMGIGTLLKAKQIYLLAWGNGKASILKSALMQKPSVTVPASYLQNHRDTKIILDMSAAKNLSSRKSLNYQL